MELDLYFNPFTFGLIGITCLIFSFVFFKGKGDFMLANMEDHYDMPKFKKMMSLLCLLAGIVYLVSIVLMFTLSSNFDTYVSLIMIVIIGYGIFYTTKKCKKELKRKR